MAIDPKAGTVEGLNGAAAAESLLAVSLAPDRTALAAAGVVAGLADRELGLEEFSALFGLLALTPVLRFPVDRPFGTASCHPSSDRESPCHFQY
uniref:Uncharacterized protein n=1 Tax=Oryza nivara TaxID=4536 RepID=A0A0E0G4G7_ORYNI